MQSRYRYLMAALLISAGAQAEPIEHCPAIATIDAYGEVYRAKGEWLGIAPASASGPVKSFVEAIFYPSPNHADGEGKLAKCSYRLNVGVLDMTFKPERTPLLSLHEQQHWQRSDGPFGIVYYRCTATDPLHCQFREKARSGSRKSR